MVVDIAGDRAACSAIADLQRACAYRSAASVGILAGQRQRSGTFLNEPA
jgi:hypothetical protein